MGADMMVAAVAIKKNVKPNFDAGREFVKKLTTFDEGFLTQLVDDGLDESDPDYFNEDGTPVVEGIQKWLNQAVTDFENCLGWRAVSMLSVRDLYVYITGGMSWGDVNDEYYYFWRMANIPGLLSAMNFVEDYDQEDRSVSPAEEAAAISSIVGTVKA